MAAPTLSISAEQVCFLIVKAREFDVQDAPADVDSGSNAADDKMIDVLEDHKDNPVQQELRAFINALNEDAQSDLVTMLRIGRGDGTLDDWESMRAEAARQHNKRTAAYLLGEPLLADHLEETLSQLGMSCAEFEIGRL
jgi:hypothetical protein